MSWTDPRTLALLGASAGFLDPRGGMQGGFQGGMGGLNAGYAIQDRENVRKIKEQEAMQRIEAQEFLKVHQKQGTNPRELITQAAMSGNPHLMGMAATMQKALPTVKSTVKGYDAQGNPVFHNVMSTGEVSSTGITPAEQAMQVNQGSQVSFLDPYTLKQRGQALPMGMAPGEAARVAQGYAQMNQSANQFAQSHGLAQQNAALQRYQATQPKMVDGAWVYPPTQDNPAGAILPTELYTPPKGSAAEKEKGRVKMQSILGNDTADLISKSTGSYAGTLADTAARSLGIATEGAKAGAKLKMRVAELAGNVPRFEGPQSDADRNYYISMVGQLDDTTLPVQQRLESLKELERIHKLVKPGGTVNLSGGNNGAGAGGVSGDGWGQVTTR